MQVQLINLNGMQGMPSGMPSGMGMMSGMMGGGSPGGGGQMSAICSHEKGTTGGSGRSANAG